MADESTLPATFDIETAQRLVSMLHEWENAHPTGGRSASSFRPPIFIAPFLAKITGNAVISANRWKYSWVEVRRIATGFEDMPGGRSGTTTVDYAINGAEANNAATGIMGNGIDHSAVYYPPGFALKPVRGNRVVRMWIDFADDGTTYFTFTDADNAEEGAC